MLECSVSQLPPQDPNDYPYIKGVGAPQEGAIGVDNPVAVLSGPHVAGYPWHVAGYPWAEALRGTDPRLFLTVPTLQWD